jgi:predicted dehydrogenase
MQKQLMWGIIGLGMIATRFASELSYSTTGRLHAVASRDEARARQFAHDYGAERYYGEYGALLGDPDVDVVYIATPHTHHAEWAIEAAEAGKHVLCEKPIAPNHAQAMEIFEAARRNDVFCMEAYMYRCIPQTARLVELIRSGAIGDVRLIEATFGFGGPGVGSGRNWMPSLAGGGILDIGGYPVSMVRSPMPQVLHPPIPLRSSAPEPSGRLASTSGRLHRCDSQTESRHTS